MVDRSKCEHDFHYYPACNEDGWKCCACDFKPGEPPGFSPELDRSDTYRKVDGLLMELHHHDLVYVSNNDMGDGIVAHVVRRCEQTRRFDQYSILTFLLQTMTQSHARFWKRISTGIIAGKDPRERCACGKLATRWSITKGKSEHRCSASECQPEGVPF